MVGIIYLSDVPYLSMGLLGLLPRTVSRLHMARRASNRTLLRMVYNKR